MDGSAPHGPHSNTEAAVTAMQADPSGYGRVMTTYTKAGWRGVLPLKRGTKWPPPAGHTGYDGADPAGRLMLDWVTQHRDGNVALRLPKGVVGIDVDAYGSKRGDLALAGLEERYGALPPTWWSTSRGPGLSRISLYRCPDDLILPGQLADSIEAIQHHHRYTVVWPSVVEGRVYRWYTPDDQISSRPPKPHELAYLPEAWHEIERRARPRPTESYVPRAVEGDWSKAVVRYHAEGVEGLSAPGGRHDAMLPVVLTLVRLDHDGHPGASEALEDMRARFVAAVADRATVQDAEAEWRRMEQGAEGHVAVTPSLRGGYEDLKAKPLLGTSPPSNERAMPAVTIGDFDDAEAGEGQAEDEAEFDGGDWGFVDLEPFLSGTFQRPQPTLLEMDE